MNHLRNMTGTGVLAYEGTEIGSVQYDLDVYGDHAMRTAEGTLYGHSRTLFAAFGKNGVKLSLQSGGEVSIVVTRFDMSESAPFKVSGPVPGF